jgi:hypothetical protein
MSDMTNYANKPNTVTYGGGAGGSKPRPQSTPLKDLKITSLEAEYGKTEPDPTEPAQIGFSRDGKLGVR